MADDRLQQAIELVQSGQIKAAREQLELILKADRHNIPAWHWYAQTWPQAKEKIRVWETCLRYNPSSGLAQEALRDLKFAPPQKIQQEINVPTKAVRSQSSSYPWLIWLILGMLVVVAFLAWRQIRNSAPKDPQAYRHVQPVEYYLYTPENYSADREWPLFIGIHGAGGSGLDCWQMFQSYAEREGFILLCPSLSGPGGGWYQDPAEIVVWDIIGEVKKQYKVEQKMFLVGFSAGAQFVQGFAFDYPQYVSGVSVLSAGTYYEANLGARHIPFLVVIGDRDHAFSVEQSALFSQYLTQNGFDVQYKVLSGVGHAVTKDSVELTIDLFQKTNTKQ